MALGESPSMFVTSRVLSKTRNSVLLIELIC